MFARKDALGKKVRERFIVTCLNGIPMFSGVLISADTSILVFADVKLMQNDTAAAVGDLYIDRSNVAYLQKVAQSVPV